MILVVFGMTMQVQESFFTDMDELNSWLRGKVDPCARPDKPDKLHPNWRLCEYYFFQDKGVDLNKDQKIDEAMSRDAQDLAGGLALLDTEEHAKKKAKMSLNDQHKSICQKFLQTSSKLAKGVSQSEAMMPTYKRSWQETAFRKFKFGVQSCRERREEALDDYEDLKEIEGKSDDEKETIIEKVKALVELLAESLAALNEAKKLNVPVGAAAIKSEDAPAQPALPEPAAEEAEAAAE